MNTAVLYVTYQGLGQSAPAPATPGVRLSTCRHRGLLQVPEIQLLEPTLCLYDSGKYQSLYESVYAALSKAASINLVTFYDDVGEAYQWVCKLPVKAISMDFCGVVRIHSSLTFIVFHAECFLLGILLHVLILYGVLK